MEEREAEVIGVYVGHCLVKCAGVVLASRVLGSPRKPPDGKAKKWFSLALDEIEPAAKELARCRANPRQPIVLKIFLRSTSTSHTVGKENPVENDDVLLEHWELVYDTTSKDQDSIPGSGFVSQSHAARMDKLSVYKNMVILTRSLYSYLRILPAFRLYRAGKNEQSRGFDIVYTISRGKCQEPISEDPQTQFQHFRFADLGTPSGAVKIEVHYRPASMIRILEETTHTQSLPRIISDYVNTPRQLHSLNVSVQKTPVVVSAGNTTPGSQSNRPPLLHRHSWSSKDIQSYGGLAMNLTYTPSPSSASPKPSVPNGPRYASNSQKIQTRSLSGPAPSEAKDNLLDTANIRSFSFNQGSEMRRDKPPPGVKAGRDQAKISQTHEDRTNVSYKNEGGQGRKVSTPVSIPGARSKRLGSFQDLSTTMDSSPTNGITSSSTCVASAPAHVSSYSPRCFIPSPKTRKAHGIDALRASGSGSSYGTACSAQLPFACTPPGFLSSGEQTESFGMSSCDPSPPISGRDISALALIRRPSWSSRSFDMSNPKFSDPLDPWLSSGGQGLPRTVIPVNASADAHQRPISVVTKSPPNPVQGPMTASIVQRSDVFQSFLLDSSESDMLPFALDGDGFNGHDISVEGENNANLCAGTSTSATEGSSSQSDAAVVSFLRLMQEAPPLTSPGTSPSVSIERAKAQLKEFKVKVEGFKLDEEMTP